MKVIAARGQDRKRHAEWVTVPAAQVLPHGFSHLEGIVRRVLSSPADSSWATISSASGRSGISVAKHRGVVALGVSVNVNRSRTRERSTRAFFSERGLVPSEDYLAGNGGTPKALRVLDYTLPADVRAVADLSKQALQNLFRLTETSILHVRFTERYVAAREGAKATAR